MNMDVRTGCDFTGGASDRHAILDDWSAAGDRAQRRLVPERDPEGDLHTAPQSVKIRALVQHRSNVVPWIDYDMDPFFRAHATSPMNRYAACSVLANASADGPTDPGAETRDLRADKRHKAVVCCIVW